MKRKGGDQAGMKYEKGLKFPNETQQLKYAN